MSSIYEKVGRTAFVIAQWRSEETEAADPLFSDHVANIFLNAETAVASQRIAEASPSTRFLVRYRTRYFDNEILRQIERGVTQFILLGSGLDTRPLRLGAPGVMFFEVEQAHVLDYKREQLEKFGYYPASSFIGADYTSVDHISALEEHGFDRRRETFILWEGNVFYLKHENVCSVLRDLGSRLERFEIMFDYLSKKLIERSTGFRKSEDLLDGFSSIGAPWNTGFDDISELAELVGLDVANDLLIADYINRTNPELKVDRSLFDDYSIGSFRSRNS